MFRFLFAPVLILAGLLLAGCTSSDEDSGDAPKKAAAPLAELHAPTTATDSDWKLYLQQVVSRNMAGVTDRVFPYYLPANSTLPTPGDAEGRSQFDRQLENVTAASNVSSCRAVRASMCPLATRALTVGAIPWYRSPPAWMPGGMNVCPSVYILTIGAIAAASP